MCVCGAYDCVHLVCRDTVELWQQPQAIFLFDQDPLQGLLVLLNLVDGLTVAASHFLRKGAAHTARVTERRPSRYLLRTVDENAVQDEVGPEERPLALDVFKQLQLRRLVVQAAGILETQGQHSSIEEDQFFWNRIFFF